MGTQGYQLKVPSFFITWSRNTAVHGILCLLIGPLVSPISAWVHSTSFSQKTSPDNDCKMSGTVKRLWLAIKWTVFRLDITDDITEMVDCQKQAYIIIIIYRSIYLALQEPFQNILLHGWLCRKGHGTIKVGSLISIWSASYGSDVIKLPWVHKGSCQRLSKW